MRSIENSKKSWDQLYDEYKTSGTFDPDNLLHTGMSRIKMNGGWRPPPLTCPLSTAILKTRRQQLAPLPP